MKAFKFLIFAIFALTLSSCRHTSEPLNVPLQFTQLNTVIAPWQKDNDLLPWKGQNHIMIINSIEDVYATQTERFIQENPNWLKIDFSTESIIAVRSILDSFDYWQYSSVIGFSKINYEDATINYYKGDYHLSINDCYSKGDYLDKDQDRIYQVAIVTHKINSDSKIHLSLGYYLKDPSLWDK